tara:strand:+ start:502 stop:678 length:177 start_codon:yes stop_codon:yes gene_type:complete
MNKIKFLKSKRIKLGGKQYKPYMIGSLPSTFGFIYNEEKDQDGISEWFNYKGLTYVPV